jgi:hypothetical protein
MYQDPRNSAVLSNKHVFPRRGLFLLVNFSLTRFSISIIIHTSVAYLEGPERLGPPLIRVVNFNITKSTRVVLYNVRALYCVICKRKEK